MFQWTIWAILVFIAASSVYFFLTHKQGLQAGTVSTVVNQVILVVWSFYFPQFNKFHLLWLTPLTYVWGWPAMVVLAFIRSKWIVLGVAVAINVFLLHLLT